MDNISRGSQRLKLFSLIGLIVLFIICTMLIFYPDYESPRIVRYLILIEIMFALSIAIFLIGRKFEFENRHKRLFLLIIVLALLPRFIMLYSAGDKFYLSDDVYRYIWDGKINANGINPFKYSPTSVELEQLRDSIIYPNINFPYMPTIYPPMAQNIFCLAYILGGDGTLVFKIISAFFELMTLLALIVWLRKIGIPLANLLLYLFSPLILTEFYLSAHLDILALPFFVIALITLYKKQPVFTAIFLACASLVKFFGLFLVPFLLFYFKGKKRWLFLWSFIVTAVLLYLPYTIGVGWRVLGSLPVYLKKWHFFASIYDFILLFFSSAMAHYIIWVLFIALLFYLIFRKLIIYDKMYALFAGYIILTPAIFPWYLVWIFPFILRNLSPAFWYLTGSILLSYNVYIEVYRSSQWTEVLLLKLLCYIPFFIILTWEIVSHVKRSLRSA